MAVVTGMSASRMLAIEAASIVDGDVVSGNLELTKHDGTKIIAGSVIGPSGPSAYDTAVSNGFVGTEQDWLDSLQGVDGDSAYQVALANGYVGTEAAWLLSLHGADGDDGSSATIYEGITITGAVNLNTYTTPGIYIQKTNYHGGTNYPEILAGVLEVFEVPDQGIIQRWVGVYSPEYFYIRANTFSWSPWKKVYTPEVRSIAMRRSTNQTIPNNTWTTIQFESADYANSMGWNNITYDVTASLAGLYATQLMVKWVANATGIRGIRILVDDVLLIEKLGPAANSEYGMFVAKKKALSTSQKFKYQVFQTSGADLAIVGDADRNTSFELDYLRA